MQAAFSQIQARVQLKNADTKRKESRISAVLF